MELVQPGRVCIQLGLPPQPIIQFLVREDGFPDGLPHVFVNCALVLQNNKSVTICVRKEEECMLLTSPSIIKNSFISVSLRKLDQKSVHCAHLNVIKDILKHNVTLAFVVIHLSHF